jgi:hypothetical protein
MKAVFRKNRGSTLYSNPAEELKKKTQILIPSIPVICFQGSELSVETTGAAFVPILNALSYNLYLPGNWK